MIVFAAVCGALGVVLGAIGAHGLDAFLRDQGYDAELISRRLAQFDTGVRYQLIHSVALLALAGLPFGSPASRHWVSRLFLLGILLFSGSLYALVLTNEIRFGMVAPVGGLCWVVGWLTLLQVARRSSSG